MPQESITKKLILYSEKLLMLSTSNRLISVVFHNRASGFRFIDELPQKLYEKISSNMEFAPLPHLDSEPPEEKKPAFKNKLEELIITDETYNNELNRIYADDLDDQDEIAELEADALRELKDRLRKELGLPERVTGHGESDLRRHAKSRGINPSYDLPKATPENIRRRNYNDNKIQTLLLPDILERRLQKLRSEYRTNLEEKGQNTLFLCLGFLEWVQPKSTTNKKEKKRLAPLLMIQVEFNLSDSKDLKIKAIDNNIQTNQTLSFYLNNVFGLTLPPTQYISSDAAEDRVDIEKYFQDVSECVEQEQGWRVLRRASLGIFNPGTLAMHEDLRQIAENPNELLTKLLSGRTISGNDDIYEIDDDKFRNKLPALIEPADASQHSAIMDLLNGDSFVLRGPPGTGKSQTICNMIAAALYSGKKTLFLASKEAALEVVRTRLDAAGLDECVLKLYSSKASKQVFWDSIKSRLKSEDQKIPMNFDEKLDELKKVRDDLNDYCSFIGKDFGNTGRSVHDLLWDMGLLKQKYSSDAVPDSPFPGSEKLTSSEKRKLIEKFQSLEEQFKVVYENVDPKFHPWKSAKSAPSTTTIRDEFVEEINQFNLKIDELKRSKGKASDLGIDFFDMTLLAIQDLKNLKELASDENLKQLEIDKKFVLTIFDKETKELKDSLEAIETVNEINQTKKNIKENKFELHELDLIINQIRENNLLEINQEMGSIETILSSKKEELQNLEIKLKVLFEFFEKLQYDINDINSESLKILEKLKFLKNNQRDILARISGRLNDQEFRKKINLIFNAKELGVTLEETSDLNYLPSAIEIRKAALKIRESSFLSFMNSEYRHANKLYKKISSEKLDKKSKVKLLENVAKFQDLEKTLRNDPLVADIFEVSSIRDVDFDQVKFLKDLLDNLDSLTFRQKTNSIFNFLNTRTQEFVELYDDCKLGNYNFRELKFYNDNDLNLSEHLSSLEILIQTLTDLTSLIKKKEIESKTFQELLKFKATFDKLDTLKINLNKIYGNLPFFDKNWLGTDQKINERYSDFIKQLTKYDLERRQLFLKNFKNIAKSKDYLDQLYSNLNISLLHLEKASTILQANPFDFEKKFSLKFKEIDKFKDLQERMGSIDDFFDYSKAANEWDAEYEPIKKFFKKLIDRPDPSDFSGKFEFWLVQEQYKFLLSNTRDQRKLDKFKGRKLNELTSNLKTLDSEIQVLMRAVVKAKAQFMAKDAPRGRSGIPKEKTESELLKHGATLPRQPRGTVRNHLFRSSEALTCFLPCWMATPSNVSTYMPRDIEFDLVIIDEASQMSPEEALPALARSNQCIIVGDENQLPPSSRIERNVIDETEEIDEQESILDLAKTVWNVPRSLLWHYRSKHQDLIKFQNNFIYEDSLIIPTSTFAEDHPYYGVHHHFLPDAIYVKGGTNSDEVEKIIELTLDHAKNFPEKSLGIAVMNYPQKNLVEGALHRAMQDHKFLEEFREAWRERDEGLDRFFIKNLENVQGDERDVIIVGTNFGKQSESSRVLQQFGPMGRPGGERRLNVITTRAREALHLVTSLKSTDVNEDSQWKGVQFLSKYIAFARTKDLGLPGTPTGDDTDSPFEDWAIEQIRAAGYIAHPQVGVQGYKIDIGVKHPDLDGYILAVECDGATYHSSSSARDRDLNRQDQLERQGWDFHRIWSTDWIWQPEETADNLRKALEKSYRARARSAENA